MSNYEVFFQIGEKKLKMTVRANSQSDAQQKVKDAIVFHKTVEQPSDSDQSAKQLKDLADILGITF